MTSDHPDARQCRHCDQWGLFWNGLCRDCEEARHAAEDDEADRARDAYLDHPA